MRGNTLLFFNMEKEFLTYEQALSLKELGFNEGCFAYWWEEKEILEWERKTKY